MRSDLYADTPDFEDEHDLDPEGPSQDDIDRFGEGPETCPSCGAEVYDLYGECPKCGHVFEERWKGTGPVAAIIALILVGVLVFVFVL